MPQATTTSTFWSTSSAAVMPAEPSPLRIDAMRADGLEMTVFNVGEGEAILLTRRHLALLVDGGAGMKQTNQQLGAALRNYMHAMGVRLRAVVASHPHVDHTNAESVILTPAAPDVLADQVTYFDNGRRRDKEIVKNTLRAVDALGDRAETRVVEDNDLQYFRLSNDMSIWLFAAARDSHGDDYKSVFMSARFRGARLLFTGDAYRQYEKKLLGVDAFKPLMRAAVLKITHHGSEDGTGHDFVNNCQARIAAASTAEDADHKLELCVKQRLGANCKTYDTHTVSGDITIRTDGRPITTGGSDILYEVELVRPGRLVPHA